jgi:glycine/D-amino acid oxidase-like deaminating enzyme
MMVPTALCTAEVEVETPAMRTSRGTKHIVVVGDGIVGASIARAAARGGARVTVIGSGPGAGASWRSFGWLNAAQEVPDSYHRLRLVSLARYRELAVTAPYDGAVRFSGALAWETEQNAVQLIQGADEVEPVPDTFHRLRNLGHCVAWVDRSQALELEPAIARDALPDDGILYARDEGWVDVPAYTGLLLSDVVGMGGSVIVDGAVRVGESTGRAVAVLSDGTTIHGDDVVVAVGSATTSLLEAVDVAIPQRSTKAALLFTKPSSLQLRMLVRTPVGSLRPRPGGGVVVHTSVIEQALQPDSRGGFIVDDDSVTASLTDLSMLFAGGAPLRLDHISTGLRPIPGDGWTVAGRLTDLPGCSVAFTHSGATLGPIIGELLAAELLEPDFRSPLLDAFRPERFHAGIGA